MSELSDMADDIRRVLDESEKYDKQKKEFLDSFLEGVGAFFLLDYKYLDLRVDKDLYLKELKENLRYNFEAEEFYDDFMNFYFYYFNGNTEVFLKEKDYEYAIKKTVVPDLEEEIAETMSYFPTFTREMAHESALENINSQTWDKEKEEAFHSKIKSFLSPYIADVDFFPAIAYREIDFMSWQFMHSFVFLLEELEVDMKNNSIKTIESERKRIEMEKS